MLPESKEYLKKDGWSDQASGLVMMACFVGGFIGIQVVSRLLHQFMPSHVVDCDHSHDDAAGPEAPSLDHGRRQSRARSHRRAESARRSSRPPDSKDQTATENGHSHSHSHGHAHDHAHDHGHRHSHTHNEAVETTPLLDSDHNGRPGQPKRHASTRGEMMQRPVSPLVVTRGRAKTSGQGSVTRRSSIYQVQKRVLSFVKDTKSNCDELGSCYGYTDPCGQECFKHLSNRSVPGGRGQPAMLRTTTGPFYPNSGSVFHGGHDHANGETNESPLSPKFRTCRATSRDPLDPTMEEDEDEEHTHEEHPEHDSSCSSVDDEDLEAQHHHHVPTNAFLSIGLQTSIAIALHKFPEGFITYATNHANPDLGFSVFMALFVHNISEGFAMCLPLYMALGSRWRAMTWSAILGGLSQPLGAAVAVLWFKLAQRTHVEPSAVAYACLFAATAGIMVSVALQLFVESLSLNHNRNLCIFFGFIGMGIMGLSNALFAAH